MATTVYELRNTTIYNENYNSQPKSEFNNHLNNGLDKRSRDLNLEESSLKNRIVTLFKKEDEKVKKNLKSEKRNSLKDHSVIDLADAEDDEKDVVLKSHGLVGAFTYVGSDVPQGISKIMKAYGVFSDFALHSNGLHYASVTKSTNILSLTGATNLLTGYITYKRGVKTLKTASKVNDTYGIYQGKLNLVKGPLQALSGMISLPNSIMSIAAVTTAGKTALASKILTIGSSVASGAFFISLIASSSMTIHEIRKHSAEFLKEALKEDKDQAIKALIKNLMLEDEKINSICSHAFQAYKKDPSKALSKIVDGHGFSLDEKEYQSIIKYVNKLVESDKIGEGEINIVKALMISEIKKKYAARQQSFMRVFGQKTLTNLIELFKETDIEKRESLKDDIIKSARTSVKNGQWLQAVILTGCICGTALIVMGQVFSSGLLYLITQVVSLVTASILTGVDFYSLYQTMLKSKANMKEKLAIVAIAVIMVSIIVASNVFTGGVVGIVLIAVVAVLFSAGAAAGVYYTQSEHKSHKDEKDKEKMEEIRLKNLIKEMQLFEEKMDKKRNLRAVKNHQILESLDKKRKIDRLEETSVSQLRNKKRRIDKKNNERKMTQLGRRFKLRTTSHT